MHVTIRYTGMVQVRLKTERECLHLQGEEANLGQVLAAVAEKRGVVVAEEISNQHLVMIEGPDGPRKVRSDELDAPIRDGDTVLFIRPFAGG